MISRVIGLVVQALRVACPLYAIWVFIRILWLIRRKHQLSWKREGVVQLLVFYLFCLAGITIFRYGPDPSMAGRWNLIPVIHTIEILWADSAGAFLYNVVGNLIWFVPLGVLLPFLSSRFQAPWSALLTGGLVSACIEISQLVLGTGVCDIDDLLLNALGALLGWGVWKLFFKLKRRGTLL